MQILISMHKKEIVLRRLRYCSEWTRKVHKVTSLPIVDENTVNYRVSRGDQEMALSSTDFSVFQSQDSPIPHDITFQVEDSENGAQNKYLAHR